MPNFRCLFIYFSTFFGALVAFWTVPSICWQLFGLLAAQTLTVNGTSPFFYSFSPPWETVLNATQPFLPGGGEVAVVGVVVSTGKQNGGGEKRFGGEGGCRQKRWWKRAAGMGGEVIGVIRHARKGVMVDRLELPLSRCLFSFLASLSFCVCEHIRNCSQNSPQTIRSTKSDITAFLRHRKQKHKLSESMCLLVSL